MQLWQCAACTCTPTLVPSSAAPPTLPPRRATRSAAAHLMDSKGISMLFSAQYSSNCDTPLQQCPCIGSSVVWWQRRRRQPSQDLSTEHSNAGTHEQCSVTTHLASSSSSTPQVPSPTSSSQLQGDGAQPQLPLAGHEPLPQRLHRPQVALRGRCIVGKHCWDCRWMGWQASQSGQRPVSRQGARWT